LLDLGNRSVEGRLFSEALRSLPLETIVDAALHSAQQQHAELVLSRQKLTLAVSASKLALEPSPGVLIVLHDVTDLRRLERMRRDFVSNVSHELKTPLTSIQAYADTLLEGGLEDVDHNRDFVTRIVEQAERLQTLILDILRLARIESVDVGMEIEPIDLLPLIEECVSEREAVSAAKRVELRVDSTLAPIMVRGEAEGLRTIIDNLVDNALNYTPAGGSVTIRTRVEGDEACLSVIDTGVGIPREHQERVFERFYRVDRARSRALGGTGLGLSIVKHLAQTFGGRVELESQPNEGSHFRVWLQTPAEFTAK
jgi:two-component system phosphate regulon sensor histidine kinase PhoR